MIVGAFSRRHYTILVSGVGGSNGLAPEFAGRAALHSVEQRPPVAGAEHVHHDRVETRVEEGEDKARLTKDVRDSSVKRVVEAVLEPERVGEVRQPRNPVEDGYGEQHDRHATPSVELRRRTGLPLSREARRAANESPRHLRVEESNGNERDNVHHDEAECLVGNRHIAEVRQVVTSRRTRHVCQFHNRNGQEEGDEPDDEHHESGLQMWGHVAVASDWTRYGAVTLDTGRHQGIHTHALRKDLHAVG